MTRTSIFCRFLSFDDSKRLFYRIVKTNYLTSPVGRLVLVMPPTLKKWGTHWLRLVRMCVCIHVRDTVLKLHVWIPHGKIADAYIWFSVNYLPLLNYSPLTNKGMKFCKCRISKSIIARNLKLAMLIGDDD